MDIDPERALAALTRLEDERERRLQEKIEAGEVLVISDAVFIGDESELAEAIERAKARARAQHGDRNFHFDFTVVITGVPRPWDEPSDDYYAACVKPDVSESTPSPPLDCESPPGETEPPAGDQFENEEAASESIHKVSPIYIWTTIRHGGGRDDLGEIAEGITASRAGLWC